MCKVDYFIFNPRMCFVSDLRASHFNCITANVRPDIRRDKPTKEVFRTHVQANKPNHSNTLYGYIQQPGVGSTNAHRCKHKRI